MNAKLPRNLSALTKAAAKSEHVRYATNHIYLTAGLGAYRCEATDGRILAIIQGNDAEPQDGIKEVLVTQDFWKAMLKVGNAREDVQVATRGFTTLAAGTKGCTITGHYFHTASVKDVPGVPDVEVLYWPLTNKVIPQTNPQVSVTFAPDQLRNLLEVALGIGLEQVSLHWFGAGQPVALTGKNAETGQVFDAMFVPIPQPQ